MAIPTTLRFSRFEEATGYCGKCLRQSPVGRQGINHVPHLILTLLTAGLWAIFWIRDARRERPWQCLNCGATVYRIMSNPFEETKRKWR
jgi:heterodisulfide reductase subunit C